MSASSAPLVCFFDFITARPDVTCQHITVLALLLDKRTDPAFRAHGRASLALTIGTMINAVRAFFEREHKSFVAGAAFGRDELAVGKVGTRSKAGLLFFDKTRTAFRAEILIIGAAADMLHVVFAVQ